VNKNQEYFVPEKSQQENLASHFAPSGLSYKDAGVDIDAGSALVEKIKPVAARTQRPGVLAGLGGSVHYLNFRFINTAILYWWPAPMVWVPN
jgi:hypothetical protein